MKTLNKNLRVTEKEYKEIQRLFDQGITFVRKITLYGAGHPQLPRFFALRGTDKQKREFFKEHETTHAKFKEYNSFEDIAKDPALTRDMLASKGFEFDKQEVYIFEL